MSSTLSAHLLTLLITYRYVIIVPLAFLEGHFISLICGFLAKMGVLNPYIAAACIIAGNLLGDVFLYWLGYTKGERFLKRWGSKFGLDEKRIIRGRAIFHSHKAPILFFSKLTNGFGLATAILFAAGLSRIKFSTYMLWNFIGECIWTSGLVLVGYFLGRVYDTIGNYIFKVGVVGVLLVVIVLMFLFIQNYFKEKVIYES